MNDMTTDALELYCRNLSKAKNDLTEYDRALLMDVSARLCELQSRTAEDDKAREEGRLVVLDTPCKPLVWGDDDHDTLLCPDCGEDLMGVFDDERALIQCPNCGQYISGEKAITRQEAEAALEVHK